MAEVVLQMSRQSPKLTTARPCTTCLQELQPRAPEQMGKERSRSDPKPQSLFSEERLTSVAHLKRKFRTQDRTTICQDLVGHQLPQSESLGLKVRVAAKIVSNVREVVIGKVDRVREVKLVESVADLHKPQLNLGLMTMMVSR